MTSDLNQLLQLLQLFSLVTTEPPPTNASIVKDFPQMPIVLEYNNGLAVKENSEAPAAPPRRAPRWATTTPPPPRVARQAVDYPVPSCHERIYLPKLVYPTPEDRARIQAEVEKVLEIRVKGEVERGKLRDVLFGGSLNAATKSRTAHDEFVISWKPVASDLGNNYSICFTLESQTDSCVYYSDVRCVVVGVGDGTGSFASGQRRGK
ncbi:uncharacterized protein LOC115404608 [Salarias fasciatus]|uniref:uncharacterized protein LOC115404608 n=1 Tax=Salarias fasciatus TaxID=181472 RepID=UPI0011769D73|nr:uncharacterized protein LOC115404608 [Salarias fasciatus]